MERRCSILCVVVIGLLTMIPSARAAEPGTISGRVVDSQTGDPLSRAFVAALDPASRFVGTVFTDADGHFVLSGLGASHVNLQVSRFGYQVEHLEGIVPGGAQAADLEISVRPQPFMMAPIVVTAERIRQLGLEAPVAISVVTREEIQSQSSVTPVDPVRQLPGIDWNSKGLTQKSFATRGGRGATSAVLSWMQDFRPAGFARTGQNFSYTLPMTNEDIERIEVIRGPATAIYGPGASRGVVHVVSRSPFDSEGTSVSLGGGNRDVTMTSFRHAALINERWTYKVSGQTFRGDDWEYEDPAVFGDLDYRNERWTGEATVGWKPVADSEILLSWGIAEADNFEMLPDGPIQVIDGRMSYFQARATHGRLFFNAFRNASDAGDTYFPVSAFTQGNPFLIVDTSRAYGAQIRHSSSPLGWVDLIYGADLETLNPRTGGTLHGRFEDNDTSTRIGGYVTSTVPVQRWLDLSGSVRVDYNDRSAKHFVAPRFGLLVRPASAHAIRANFSRTGSAGVVSFWDTTGGFIGGLAIKEDGWQFDRDSQDGVGGLWMRPRVDPSRYVAADVTEEWDYLVSNYPELVGLPVPDASEVGTELRLRDLRTGQYVPISPDEVVDLEQPTSSPSNHFEVGYKGVVRERFSVSLDGWYRRIENAGSESIALTPNVFVDEASLAQYLVDNGMSQSTADSLATAIGRRRVGTVEPVQAGETNTILVGSRRTGESLSYWGADLGLEYQLSDRIRIGATYSLLQDNVITEGPGQILSVPENKGSLRILLDRGASGWSAGVQARFVESFEVQNSLITGRTPGYAVYDAHASYRFASRPGRPTTTIHLSANNVFDRRYIEYAATPKLGRLLLARVQVDY